MTVRAFLAGSSLTSIVAFSLWLLVINWINPAEVGVAGMALFFLTLFLATAGFIGLLGYGVRALLQPSQLSTYHLRPALRQGVWAGLYLNCLLFLQLQRLLQWWIALILAIFFLCFELFYISFDYQARRSAGKG